MNIQVTRITPGQPAEDIAVTDAMPPFLRLMALTAPDVLHVPGSQLVITRLPDEDD